MSTAALQTAQEQPAKLADLPWWQVFQDPVLQQLVAEAIRQNYDLKNWVIAECASIWRDAALKGQGELVESGQPDHLDSTGEFARAISHWRL